MNEDDPLWSVRRVREHLDVSDRWLRRALSAGRFPAPDLRLGRQFRWKRSTVLTFVQGKETRLG